MCPIISDLSEASPLGVMDIEHQESIRPRLSATRHWRCDHFTTLATLTMNVLATKRQDWPEATAATTRSRRSKE
jgi:hypothetical protein